MPWMGDAHNRYYAEGGTVTDQQIREWYEANRGAENFGELARREMENSGLTNERVNAALTAPVMPDFNNAPQLSADLSNAELSQIYQANNGDPAAVNKAIAARLTTPSTYSDYGGGDNFTPYDPMTMADGIRRGLEQHLHTAGNRMSRDDFLKKYGTTFVADDKGGNAASEVAGVDVAGYYDRYLAPGAKGNLVSGFFEGPNPDGTYQMPDFGAGKYSDANPYFDAWDNVKPHPESQRGNGWDEAWKTVGRPVATAVAMYYGLPLLAGAGGAGAAATAGAGTAAPGLAGMVGMNAGMGATALNAGALNAGMTALRGGNLEDSLRSGLVGAALSPVGTMAGKAATSALGSTVTNPNLLKAVGTVAGNTAVGGAGAALTGRDIGKGLTSGALNGLVSAAGSYVGGQAAQAAGGNKLVGGAAAIGTQAALTGRKIRPEQLIGLGLDGIAAKVDGVDPALAKSILSVLVARDPTNAAARIALNNIVRTGAVMGKPTRRNASGGHIKRNFYEGDFVDSGENSGDGGDSITFGWEPTVDDEEVVNPIVDDSPMPYRPSIDSEAANHEGQTYEAAYKAYLEQLAIAEYIQRYENDPNQTNAETMRLLRNNEMLANGESPLSWGELEGIDTNNSNTGGKSGKNSGFDWGSLLKALTGLAAVNEATRANSGASNTAAYGTPESLRTGTATSVDPTDYKYTFDPRTGKYTLVGDPAAAVVHGATGVDMYGANERAHIPAAAKGGAIQNAGLAAAHASTKPRFIQGAGDGLSDSVPVQMDDGGPGRLADGEFVIPADVVSGLGNGSSKAGAKLLYQMMDNIRKRAHGHTRQTRPIDPKKVLPA